MKYDNSKHALANVQQRTMGSYLNDAAKARQQRLDHHRGVKGESELTKLRYDFDIIKDTLVDPMHIVEGLMHEHLGR